MNLDLNLDPERVRELVMRTFQNPTADLVSSAFVLSAFLVVLLMLVLFLLLFLTPRRRKIVKVRRYRRIPVEGAETAPTSQTSVAEKPLAPDEADVADDQEPAAETGAKTWRRPAALGRALALLSSVTVPLLILLSLSAGYWVTGTQDYCARTCHAGTESVDDARKLDHAPCTSCHERPGLSGIPANIYTRVHMGVAQVTGREPDGSVVVDSSSCLKCHAASVKRTVETQRGIRISHKEFTDAGQTCVSCHEVTGHEARRDYSMSSCLPCHGGGSASTRCALCHTDDPYDARKRTASRESTDTLGSGKISYPVVRVANRNCGGCHDQKRQCDTCHGTRMPHSQAFINGGHARYAAFEKKQMCYKCHADSGCTTGCHIGPFPGHYANWKADHSKAPKTAMCGCHSQKSGRTKPMCTLCHDF